MGIDSIKRFFLECSRGLFRRYFGLEYSEKARQDIEISKLTLSNLGLMESISDLLEEAGNRNDSSD